MSQPEHIAIIMDGNGRWAQTRGHHRVFGHLRGAKTAREIIVACAEKKISYLTLFTFSTENWFRPKSEVAFLMKLLVRQLKRERKTLIENNIRFHVIGDLTQLPPETRTVVEEAVQATCHLTGMHLTFALNYGGRQDVTAAARSIAKKVLSKEISPEQIDEALVDSELMSSFLPHPDLIIRTSGEHRLSNFFLWQAAYSELFVSHVLWPDFKLSDLQTALDFYSTRERRFGRIKSSSRNEIETVPKR